jgi:hypothetical protein
MSLHTHTFGVLVVDIADMALHPDVEVAAPTDIVVVPHAGDIVLGHRVARRA